MHAAGLPRWKMFAIIGGGLAFYLGSLYDVFTRRQDWPLSCYPMYWRKASKLAVRQAVVGVSDRGEFPLTDAQTSPFRGQRLKVLAHALARDDERFHRFMLRLGKTYERKRRRRGWPALRAIRFYDERWRVQPGLKGIDSPERVLTGAAYFAPKALRARLAREVSGSAEPERGLVAHTGDVLIELGPEHCRARCAGVDDRYAAEGRAVELAPSRRAKAALRVGRELARGRYFVYLRMKTDAKRGHDWVELELDGKRVDSGRLGRYRAVLADPGWVWASAEPGYPPLVLRIEQGGRHELGLSTRADVRVDQVWLSRDTREIPGDNRPRFEP